MPTRLTIITPVLNGVRFIEYCLRNVIDQCCPDMEHIIVDGGSTDGTVEIIRRYAAEYPHIRWVSEVDRGQSDAMNKGLYMASGEIVGFLNSDDYYESGTLNEVLMRFQSLPEPSLLVGNCTIWGEGGVRLGVGKPMMIGYLSLLCGWLKAFPMNPSSYFYHHSLHDRTGIFDVEEHYVMDIDFLLRATQSAHVKYADRNWGNMRYLPGTKTYDDVALGLNRCRSGIVLDRYRSQSPLFYRFASSLVVLLVKVCKPFLKYLR